MSFDPENPTPGAALGPALKWTLVALAVIALLSVGIFAIQAVLTPAGLAVERKSIEQSRSYSVSLNQQAAAYLAEASKATDPGQKIAMKNAACNIISGNPDLLNPGNRETLNALGGCR